MTIEDLISKGEELQNSRRGSKEHLREDKGVWRGCISKHCCQYIDQS